MLLKGMDVPSPLLRAPEGGHLVVFAGAGVSMPPPSKYPDFDDLARSIGDGTGITPRPAEPVDMYLGRLASCGVAVHERAAQFLSNPDSKPSPLHHDLVGLFPTGQCLRIVTTNFDDHFTTVVGQRFPDVRSYHAPALPVGSRFAGLVYLHGFVHGPTADLVLTDADLGRAYLNEGWARRFLLDLFSATDLLVMFVGYSADDPPVRYMARALPVGGGKRYALTLEERADHWTNLGIEPLVYPKCESDEDKHRVLTDTLQAWVEYARMGALDHDARIRQILSQPPPLGEESRSYLLESLDDQARRHVFVTAADQPAWLEWAESEDLLEPLFRTDAALGEKERDLSQWCATCLGTHLELLFRFLARRRGSPLNPHFWWRLGHLIRQWGGQPVPPTQAALIRVLLETAPPGDHRSHWLSLLEAIDIDASPDVALILIDEILRPRIAIDTFSTAKPRIELASESGHEYELSQFRERLVPQLPKLAARLLPLLERHIRVARATLASARGISSANWDPTSWLRSAIEPHDQNFDWTPMATLIDVARDTLAALQGLTSRDARLVVDRWADDEHSQLLVRLAINGMREDSGTTADAKIRWILSHGFLYRLGLKHEAFQLLRDTYGRASDPVRRKLIAATERGDPDFDLATAEDDDKRRFAHEIYEVLAWLHQTTPECAIAEQALDRMQESHPEFKPHPYPDFYSWVGPVSMERPGPGPEIWLQKDPEEAAASESGVWDFHGIAEAAGRDFDWSWSTAEALARRGRWDASYHWQGLVSGWEKGVDGEADWSKVLGFLSDHVEELRGEAHSMASMLATVVDRLPAQCRDAAQRLAAQLGELVSTYEYPLAPAGPDILWKAINHPVGRLADFWIHVTRPVASEQKAQLVDSVKAGMQQLLNVPGRVADCATAIFAGRVHYLYSLDPIWARDELLPLLDWARDPGTALSAWQGYLYWGGWTRELLPQIAPHYVQLCSHLEELPETYQGKLAQHMAGIFLYSKEEAPLQAFLRSAPENLLRSFANHTGHLIRSLQDKDKARFWKERLEPYWAKRQQGIPSPLKPAESAAMLGWLPNLEPIFSDAVDLACRGAAPADPEFLFWHLVEGDMASKQPDAVRKLLNHLLPSIETPSPSCEYVAGLIVQLGEAGQSPEALKPLVENSARIGCNISTLWARIRSTAG